VRMHVASNAFAVSGGIKCSLTIAQGYCGTSSLGGQRRGARHEVRRAGAGVAAREEGMGRVTAL